MTQTTAKATKLQTQILCVNTLYQHSKEIIAAELTRLTPFIGLGILKTDGSFKKKYEAERLTYKYKVNQYGFDFWVDTHYYFSAAYGKLSVKVRTTVSGGGYDKHGVNCNNDQQSQSFDLFNIDAAGKLQPLEVNREFLDKVYNEAEILAAAANVEAAAKQYEAVLKTVPYLFRSTLYLQRLCN